ncbi:Alpha/Beta hydrolase protein [Dendryphion nanum]|uniref:Alpha/Beta hydrolase protein n=1 Tax=Dendryphion nanum TaxID=256645 RepID=A0A9P9IG56_9PLEO|nr:Alpha/Beta hydrolase protein [Dendryphion nanum]
MTTQQDLDDTTGETRFDTFTVYRTFYKQIGDHQIEVGILIPKSIKPGKHPLLVKFHGGGLITGTALFPDWFAAFFVPFIHRTSSIVVLPNYRLIPEHRGKDILEDLADFWRWVDGDGLINFLKEREPGIEIERDRLCVSGDSAGGFMALQSAITLPEGRIRAVLAQYPMTNVLRRKPTDRYGDGPAPGPEIIDEHVAAIKPGSVVSSATPPARQSLSYALAAYGRWEEFFGTAKNLLPIRALEDVKSFPPTFIVHAEQDTAVAVEDTKGFVLKLIDLFGREFVRQRVMLVCPDGDHGFDMALKEKDTPWLRDGLAWVEEWWLG